MSAPEIVSALRHRIFKAASEISKPTTEQRSKEQIRNVVHTVLQELTNPTRSAIPLPSSAVVLKSPLKTTKDDINDLKNNLQRSTESINSLKTQLKEANEELVRERASIEELKQAIAKGGNQEVASIVSTQEKETKDKLQADLEKLKSELKKTTNGLKREKNISVVLSTKIVDLEETIKRLNAKLKITPKESHIHATSAKEVKTAKRKKTISSVSSGPPLPPPIVVVPHPHPPPPPPPPPIPVSIPSQPQPSLLSSSSLLSASDIKRIPSKKSDEDNDIIIIKNSEIVISRLLRGIHILLSDNKIFSALCATFITKIDPRFPKQIKDQIISAIMNFRNLESIKHERASEDATMIYLIKSLMDSMTLTLRNKFGNFFGEMVESANELAKVIANVPDKSLNNFIDDYIIQYFMERYNDQRLLALDENETDPSIPKTTVNTNSIFQSLESRIILLEYLPVIGMTLNDTLKQDKLDISNDIIRTIEQKKKSIECYSSGNYQMVAKAWNEQLKRASTAELDVPLLVESSSSSSSSSSSVHKHSIYHDPKISLLSSYPAPYSSTELHPPTEHPSSSSSFQDIYSPTKTFSRSRFDTFSHHQEDSDSDTTTHT